MGFRQILEQRAALARCEAAATPSGPTPAPPSVADLWRDPLADMLRTPLKDLLAPVEVFSDVLGETIFLVADDAQAAAVWDKAGVPYSAPEVAILLELAASVPPAVWADRLRLIHQAKKDFHATLRRDT